MLDTALRAQVVWSRTPFTGSTITIDDGGDRQSRLPGGVAEGGDLTAVYEALRRGIARADTGWMLDWTDAHDGDSYIYIDSCHATRAGHEIIADRLLSLLEPTLLRRRAAAPTGGVADVGAAPESLTTDRSSSRR